MDTATTILIACFGSAGLWTVINSITAYIIEKRKKKDDNGTISKEDFETVQKGVRGLLYGELEKRCSEYIQRGHISASDLNSLRKYYYEPYQQMHGNGTITKLMERVSSLDIVDD